MRQEGDFPSVIEDAKIHESSKLYRGVAVKMSSVGEQSELGDFSRITSSKLKGYNRIGRSSLVYHSTVGEYSYCGANDVIMHSSLGKFCSISWNVTIGPANHDYRLLTTHDFLYNDYCGIKPIEVAPAYDRFTRKTRIGNDVWVGVGAVIVNGVSIGDGAVIGANAVVTKDVPPYAIVAGVPAKVIRYRFKEKMIEELLKLEWWNLPKEVIHDNYSIFSTPPDDTTLARLRSLI